MSEEQKISRVREGYRPATDVVQKGYQPIATGKPEGQHPPAFKSSVIPSNGGSTGQRPAGNGNGANGGDKGKTTPGS